jgi:hypothetical protein
MSADETGSEAETPIIHVSLIQSGGPHRKVHRNNYDWLSLWAWNNYFTRTCFDVILDFPKELSDGV